MTKNNNIEIFHAQLLLLVIYLTHLFICIILSLAKTKKNSQNIIIV